MKEENSIKNSDKIAIYYTGQLSTGRYFDYSHARTPFVYVVGKGKVLEAFDRKVIGMKVGEKKRFVISSEEAYGPLRGDLLIEVPKEKLPSHLEPEVGMLIKVPLKSIERPYPLKITHIGDFSVTIDANHPLAGRDLTYDVEIIAIKKK